MRKGLARVALAALLAIASLPLGASGARAAGCGATAAPTRTIYLPNITKTLGGPSGWVTPFIVQNVGVASTDLQVSFYRFSDGALVTCRVVPGLLPYRSFADYPNADVDLPADSQFAVVVRSFGADVIAVVNEHQGRGATAEALSYVGLSSGATSLALPFVAKLAAGWIVRVVVQNLGPTTANVNARFVSYDGSRTATLTRVIAPGASRFVDPTVEPALLAGTEYSVTLTSDQPIAAIANAHNDAPGATAPMGFSYNAVVAAPGEIVYAPSVPRNADGRTARVIVQNTGAFDAPPTLVFQRPGVPPVTVNAPAIRAGRAWSFDPRTYADGATPCPAGGAPNCVGEGEWSATASGGQFAVLVAALSATSAFGYTGTTSPGNRAYLPNITRTLGGPSGWTTPIVLQSAGATSATLRWYRFADGTLITRQSVGGLAGGAAIRVDPRSVPGLLDDTQYAVVVDAQGGNVVATVLELSFEGGDGAMAYEGFKASVSTTPVPTMVLASAPKTLVFTGAGVQATASVRDQFDNAVGLPITWSVAPPTLGTVTTTGLFTAAENATGIARLTATAGDASATLTITVAQRPLVQVSGMSFSLDGTGLADVYTEPSITGAVASTLATEVDLDVVRIQADYGRAFASRSQLYVLGSSTTYANALQAVFRYDPEEARQLSVTTAGLYLLGADAVVIDWSKVRGIVPLTAARHELTHRMEEQIAGAATLPAWLNEGNARLEELTAPGTGWLNMTITYGAASMAATGTLFTLADMTSQGVWNARSGLGGQYEYYAAAQAVRQLRDRVGMTGVLRILEVMSAGASLPEAYAFVAGEPFDAFAAAYPARTRAVAPSYPGIATATDTVAGPGLSIIFYGFLPGATVSYSITGGGSAGYNTVRASDYGTYSSFLGSDWPAGTYTISASWSGGVVTTTATKTR